MFHFQALQDFLLEGDSLQLRQSYTCKTVQNGRQGRPVYKITEFQIWGLRSVGFTWRKITSLFIVSERTLRQRRQEMGWPMREQEFSQISDDTLDIALRNMLSLSPNSGEMSVVSPRSHFAYIEVVWPTCQVVSPTQSKSFHLC